MNRKMRAFVALASTAMLVAGIVSAGAQGQGRGQGRGFGGRGGFGGGLGMLNIAEVQQELKMTQPQIEKVQPALQEMRTKMQEIFQNAGGGGGAAPDPESRAKMMAQMQEIQVKAVKDILDQKQYARYHQLELQQMGPQSLGRKDVAEALKLTDEQKTKIAAAQQSSQQKSMQIFQNAGGPQNMTDEDRKKLEEIRTQTSEAIAAVLTDAQKKQWKEMQGEPFKFPAPRRPGA